LPAAYITFDIEVTPSGPVISTFFVLSAVPSNCHIMLQLATPTIELSTKQNGDYVNVAGLVLVRQRPGTAAGICFITIEDETGFSNLVVWEKAFATFRREILQARLLMVEGKVQIEGKVIHVIVKRCFNLNSLLSSVTRLHDDNAPVITLSNQKEDPSASPIDIKRKQWQNEPFYKGRNFK